ncbi:MAG TPA: hypothetical protein VFP76_02045 [Gemmatimonadota bacterium]|nr:hypothetical protein [Gemmatimonadota bacterium]
MIATAPAATLEHGRAGALRARIVVLGGGVGGLAAARHLERLVGRRHDVDVTLVTRANFFLLSPLLFEACSGVLELRIARSRSALDWKWRPTIRS